MEALVHLCLAVPDDLIDGTQLVLNRICFEKSKITGRLEGPYTIQNPDNFIRAMYYRIQARMIYLPCIDAAPDGLTCTMVFTIATADDLKDGSQLKYNYTYYILANGVLNGPYTITQQTILKDLAQQLQQSLIYIIAHKSTQHFKEINTVSNKIINTNGKI